MAGNNGYDLGCHIYSQDGRVFQIEYAEKAVEKGGALLGVRCKDGVVIAAEKLLQQKLLLRSSGRLVHKVDKYSGVAFTGYNQDGRAIVPLARKEAANYKEHYGETVPPDVLTSRVAQFMHLHTMHSGYRPFGVSVLVTGYDDLDKKAYLHMINPAGVTYRFFGAAVGKGRQGATTELEKLKIEEMTCEEALVAMATIIIMLREEPRDKPFVLEAGWIKDAEKSFHHVPHDIIDETMKVATRNAEERQGMEVET